MSVAVQCIDCPSFYSPSSAGFSDDSKNLVEYFKKQIQEICDSFTMGRPSEEAFQSLKELYRECSAENWDGYGAKPVSEDSIKEAFKFIQMRLFPLFPTPQILAEPSGEVGLEWYKDRKMIFAISFNGKGMITYAGIFGSNKIHGEEYFGDSIPSRIIENLRRLYQ